MHCPPGGGRSPPGVDSRDRGGTGVQESHPGSAGSPPAVRLALMWLFAPPPDEKVTWVDRITTLVSRVAMLLIVVIVGIIFFEVTMRYVFFSPTLWVNEMSLWLGSMIYLLAGVYTMQRRGHIRITAVYDLVSRKVQRMFDFMALLVVVVYAFAMIRASWDVALDTLLRWEKFGTAWDPPIPATVKPLVLIATFLVAVQAVGRQQFHHRRPQRQA